MTFIYTMQVFPYIVKGLHKMITTIKMLRWKIFPVTSKKHSVSATESKRCAILCGSLYQTRVAK